MGNKQTAVEWLVNQLDKNFILDQILNNDYTVDILIEQAKEMERNNIEKAWHDGSMLGRSGWILEDYSTGEGYYTKTYGNK